MKKWTLEEDNIIRETFNNKIGTALGAVWLIQTILLTKLNSKRSHGSISNRYYSHIKPQDDEDNLINQSKQNTNTMKTTFKPLIKPDPERKYPYIGYFRTMDATVLFTAPSTGFLISSRAEPIGTHSKTWKEDHFKVIPNCTITFES